MTLFLFAGDMLVMLFMAALVVWVFWRSSDKDIEDTARIPLEDERPESGRSRRRHAQPKAGKRRRLGGESAVG